MATRVNCRRVSVLLVLIISFSVSSAEKSVGFEINCGEVAVRITVKRQFLQERRVPFKAENVLLGRNSTQNVSCRPQRPVSGPEMVISAGLHECGTESRVEGDWIVYSNHLLLFPAPVPVSRGAVSVRAVECRYKTKQTVNGQPLTPTWLPMTSTVSVFGLLHFSLRPTADGCASPRSSSVYQQGEAVFVEASVEAPLHPPLTLYVDQCLASLTPDPLSSPGYQFITKHGCLMDSLLPGSSSKFLPRQRKNRLCFSVQAFLFSQVSGKQIFISCRLRATLRGDAHSQRDKACFFNRSTFSWRSSDGDSAACECCDSEDCVRPPERGDHAGPQTGGHSLQRVTSVGPLVILPRSHWTGSLSVSEEPT